MMQQWRSDWSSMIWIMMLHANLEKKDNWQNEVGTATPMLNPQGQVGTWCYNGRDFMTPCLREP